MEQHFFDIRFFIIKRCIHGISPKSYLLACLTIIRNTGDSKRGSVSAMRKPIRFVIAAWRKGESSRDAGGPNALQSLGAKLMSQTTSCRFAEVVTIRITSSFMAGIRKNEKSPPFLSGWQVLQTDALLYNEIILIQECRTFWGQLWTCPARLGRCR